MNIKIKITYLNLLGNKPVLLNFLKRNLYYVETEKLSSYHQKKYSLYGEK
jgi:hypothetical protein